MDVKVSGRNLVLAPAALRFYSECTFLPASQRGLAGNVLEPLGGQFLGAGDPALQSTKAAKLNSGRILCAVRLFFGELASNRVDQVRGHLIHVGLACS